MPLECYSDSEISGMLQSKMMVGLRIQSIALALMASIGPAAFGAPTCQQCGSGPAQPPIPCSSSMAGPFNEVSKFICETKSAVLKALNPDLELSPCGTQKSPPKMESGHLPVSAVFVACTGSIRNSCKSIASDLMKAKNGVTVNIIVNQNELPLLQNTLDALIEDSHRLSAPLNIIPIRNPVPAYLRDPGVFQYSPQGTTYVANPYINNGLLGAESMKEVMEKCGLQFETSYRNLAVFQSTLQLLSDESVAAFKTVSEGQWGSGLQFEAPDASEKERLAIQTLWTEGPLMGGNFLALPGGTLVVGDPNLNKLNHDPRVLEQFSKTQKVITIPIPSLQVGHVDEIYNIAPSRDACGFAILRASPAETRRFLATRPSDENLGHLFGDKGPQWIVGNLDRIQELFQRKQRLLKQVSAETKDGAEADPELLRELELIHDERSKMNSRNVTTSDLLKDPDLQKFWDEAENIIAEGTKILLKEFQASTKSSCTPKVIDLPVFWTKYGDPAIANPVNGLAVNGSYFRSRSYVRLPQHKAQWLPQEKSYLFRKQTVSYPALDQYIDERLKQVIPAELHSVDTREYDAGNGNFHCATSHITLPCASGL